jgi:hypothetical protein
LDLRAREFAAMQQPMERMQVVVAFGADGAQSFLEQAAGGAIVHERFPARRNGA